jgi:hypothetical protein
MDAVSTYKIVTLINSIKIINSLNIVSFIVNPDGSELPASICGSFTPGEIAFGVL